MIDFRLNPASGVPAYVQIVQQVQQAVRLGLLLPGDQLPTVKEVVSRLAINPNTVLKAYRELDREGLVDGRRGQGTYVSERVRPDRSSSLPGLAPLTEWIALARQYGLSEDQIVSAVIDEVRVVFARSAA